MARRGKNEGSIHRRANGAWRAQVTLGGKRIGFTSKTRAEAHDWVRKILDQVDQGMTFESRNLTLSIFLREWINNKKIALRPYTWQEYERLVRLYIDPYLGTMKLKDLNINLVNRFYQALLEKRVGISSVHHIHRVLHGAMEQAVKAGVIGKNPAHGATLPRKVHNEMMMLNDQQVGQLLIAARSSRYHALYLLAVTTGMRLSELRGLQWKDIDWLRGTIKVCRQLQDGIGTKPFFSEPKTRSGYRTIRVGETTLHELQQHRERIEMEKAVAGERWVENDLVFPSTRGTPFDGSNVRKDFTNILESAELPRIRFHDLRHTAASLMLNHGIPLIVVSRRLGHSNASITLNIYAHTTVDMQNEAAVLMDELITPIPVKLPHGEMAIGVENLLHPIAPDAKISIFRPPTSTGK